MKKSVLLVGANGGVGVAVAQKLIGLGYDLFATVSRPEKLAAFKQQFPECQNVIALNLANADQIKPQVEQFISGIDQLDAVVACSAVAPFAPAETSSLSVFREAMEINCISNLAIYQATMPALRKSKGRVVFTSSLSGCVATPIMSAYVASKFALEGLTDVIRQEASEWGVEVILLQPGAIDTPMIRRSGELLDNIISNLSVAEEKLYGQLYRQMLARTNAHLKAGGIMPPENVAETVVKALEADEPSTRYRIGADAEFLIEASKTKTDRDIDTMILDSYQSKTI